MKKYTEAEIKVISFEAQDVDLAKMIEPLEETIDGINMEVKRRHIRRLRKGKCTIEQGFDLTDITMLNGNIYQSCLLRNIFMSMMSR